MLWRLDPHPSQTSDLAQLATDLRLHVRYTPLTTVLVQIGGRQQAYLRGPVCAGCLQHRCSATCRMQLLRRMLVANRVAEDLRPVPLGLAPRPYTRLALAIPGLRAQPLDGRLLSPWRDGRLWASWRSVLGRQVVGVALAVGTDGPAPARILGEYGWRAVTAPTPLVTTLAAPGIPHALPLGWVYAAAPLVLLPLLVDPAGAGTEAEVGPIITPPPEGAMPIAQSALPSGDIPIEIGGRVVALLTSALLMRAIGQLRAIETELATRSQPIATPLSVVMPTVGATAPVPDQGDEQAIPSSGAVGSAADPLPATWETPIRRARPSRRVWGVPSAVPAAQPAPPETGPDLLVVTISSPDEAGASAEHVDAGCAPNLVMVESSSDIDEIPPSAEIWPSGPAGLSASEIESLLRAIVSEPRITLGRAGQTGIAVKRLQSIYGIGAPDARALLCWLDLAGLLAAPKLPEKPWESPRPLTTSDLTQIAASLRATPIPSAAEIAAAFAQ